MSLATECIEFLRTTDVLRFGDFTTKSGRKTPYFIDMGRIRTGAQLAQLASFYARAAERDFGDGFDVVFGPAYKGIPLVCGTSAELSRRGREVAFCFNRKEVKDHGEGGVLVGHRLQAGDRVLILEDVTTAGTSIRETVPILTSAADVKLAGLLVAVDRRERGPGGRTSALEELREEFHMSCRAIVTIHDVLESVTDSDLRGRLEAYLDEYGA